MLQRCEIAVTIKPSVNTAIRDFLEPIKGDNVQKDVFPPQKLEKPPRKWAVGGGESTLQAVCKYVILHGQPTAVGIAGGGTHNVVYEYLKRKGKERTMTISQFLETPWDKFPEDLYFHPAVALDDNEKIIEVAVNHFGRGSYPTMVADLDRILRKFPSKVRASASRLGAAVPAALSFKDRLIITTISDRIGSFVAFPEQDLFDVNLTRGVIKGNYFQQWIRLALTLSWWQFSKRPPKIVLSVEKDVAFPDKFPKKGVIWVDGENVESPFGFKKEADVSDKKANFAPVTLQRSAMGIPLVALVP